MKKLVVILNVLTVLLYGYLAITEKNTSDIICSINWSIALGVNLMGVINEF